MGIERVDLGGEASESASPALLGASDSGNVITLPEDYMMLVHPAITSLKRAISVAASIGMLRALSGPPGELAAAALDECRSGLRLAEESVWDVRPAPRAVRHLSALQCILCRANGLLGEARQVLAGSASASVVELLASAQQAYGVVRSLEEAITGYWVDSAAMASLSSAHTHSHLHH